MTTNLNELISAKINPMKIACSSFDLSLDDLEDQLISFKKRYGLQLNPDFQREVVWTKEQQVKFVENLFRGTVSDSGKTILFNAPNYNRAKEAETIGLSKDMVCVDGLQRITACLGFINNDFTIFDKELGGVNKDYFNESEFSILNIGIKFQVFNLINKKDVLELYLMINDTGVAHTQEELDKVRNMIDNIDQPNKMTIEKAKDFAKKYAHR